MKIKSETPPAYRIDRSARALSADDQAIIDQALAILARRHRRGAAISGPDDAGRYLQLRYASQRAEVFGALFLDTRHRIIDCAELCHGTIDACTVHPREIVRAAIERDAQALVLFHNHPSGNPSPSSADQHLTKRLSHALDAVDIRIIDHVVVGAEGFESFAKLGLL